MNAWEAVAGPAREGATTILLDALRKVVVGKRFLIVGDHPHTGKVAECIDFQKVAFGHYRPRMRSDDGDEFFVMDAKNWRAIK